MSPSTTFEDWLQNPFGDKDAISSHPSNEARPASTSAINSDKFDGINSRAIELTSQSARCRASSEDSDRGGKHKWRSYKLMGEYHQPWLTEKTYHSLRINNYIVLVFIVLGFVLSALICFAKYNMIPKTKYCLILDDTFQNIDPNVWTHEVQINGFGTGSFDWTTTDPKNAYTDKKGLHIVPTLTNESTTITNNQIFNGYTLDLTRAGGDGTCTSNTSAACSIQSSRTLGTIIPPVRSARLTTKGKKSIKYGRVEVEFTFPKGDWLWPAIWMMPEDSSYGPWPASGEIDIAEGRGNEFKHHSGGRDYATSTLHWGPTPDSDAFWRSHKGIGTRRGDFSASSHFFGMEWSENHIATYMDSRLNQILYYPFEKSYNMWQRGHFAQQTENGSFLIDPWNQTDNTNAPFDQSFYLILNVAVGSQTGWFLDGKDNKPWVDKSPSASADFYDAIDHWYPTWGQGDTRGMTVKSVKMWQACG